MSAVFEIVPRPDWASTTTVAIPAGLTSDPEVWAKAIFDGRTVPSRVKAFFVIREGAVRLLHDAVTRSMMNRAVRKLAQVDHGRFAAMIPA